MTRDVVRVARGLSVVMLGVAIAGTAQAQTQGFAHLRNANTTHGKFYLGVKGGDDCPAGEDYCGLWAGQQLITWQYVSSPDQIWGVPPLGPTIENVSEILINPPPSPPPSSGPQACIELDDYPIVQENDTLFVNDCQFGSQWAAVTAESLGAPYPGCFAFKLVGEGFPNTAMYLSVYQGNVKNGSAAIIWPLCQPNSLDCGNPSNAWHADQFWCPEP